MIKDCFCNLHNHTEYSLLDGGSSVSEMVKRAAEIGQPALSITDHGNIHGAVAFYRECKKYDLKPIIGLEAYSTDYGVPHTRKEKEARETNHMLLLARNQDGYKNILKLSSLSWLDGFYYKPRIDYTLLEQYKSGLIVTTGCMAAEIPSLILQNADEQKIDFLFDWYKQNFGEFFFVELQHHAGIPEIVNLNKNLIHFASRHNVKMIATNDAHYARSTDSDVHDTLLCIQTKSFKNQSNRMRFSDGEYYLKTREEMERTFAQYGLSSDIFDNTLLIAEMCECNPEASKSSNHMPEVIVQNGMTHDEYLAVLTYQGMDNIYTNSWRTRSDVVRRVEYELGIISQTGFSSYYLIVAEIIDFARRNNITWNIRGSGTGSIVCYALGLSFIDPIEKGLLFERFLNPNRVTIPDLDIDFPDNRRNEIIKYLIDKYGEDRVAQIVTFGHMKARLVVRDIGRVYGYPQEYVDVLAKKIPNIPGKPITISDSLDINGEYPSPDLIEAYTTDQDAKLILDNGKALEGRVRHIGLHAAAVIITDKPLTEYTALTKPNSTICVTKHLTQFDYPTLESLGLLKVDCLGLSTLTIIDKCCELIRNRHNIDINPHSIPYEGQQEAFEILSAGETSGIFQVESRGLRSALMQMQPKNFQHIMDIISLYRPGPIDYIPTYISRLNGNESIEYAHPALEKYTKDTQGIIIYQEQIIGILSEIAQYSPGEADLVRKGISKKDQKIIDNNREKFVSGCINHGLEESVANQLWSDIEKFSLYGFNKCLTGDTIVYRASGNQYSGREVTISELYEKLQKKNTPWYYKFRRQGIKILSYDENSKRIIPNTLINIYNQGMQDVYRITLENGMSIRCTANHRNLTRDGYKRVVDTKVGDEFIISDGYKKIQYNYNLTDGHRLRNGSINNAFGENNYGYINGSSTIYKSAQASKNGACSVCGITSSRTEIAHIDGNRRNNIESNYAEMCVSCHKKHDYKYNNRNKKWDKGYKTSTSAVVSIEYDGREQTYDLEMAAPNHNFIANGIVTHNSHAASYARITMQTAYLKANYPVEFMAACLIADEGKYDKIIGYINECRRMGIEVLRPDINSSGYNFTIIDNWDGSLSRPSSVFVYHDTQSHAIRFGFSSIKHVGDAIADKLASVNNIDSLESLTYINFSGINKRAFENLIASGTFDSIMPDREYLYKNAEFILEQLKSSADNGQRRLFRPRILLKDFDTDINMSELEKDAIGVWIDRHPLLDYEAILQSIPNTTNDVNDDNMDVEVSILGVVLSVEERLTKAGEKMSFVKLSDLYGLCDVILFPRVYRELKPDEIVFIRGRVYATSLDAPVIYASIVRNNIVGGLRKKLEEKTSEKNLWVRFRVDDNEIEDIEKHAISAPGRLLEIYKYKFGNPNGVIRMRNMALTIEKARELGLQCIMK